VNVFIVSIIARVNVNIYMLYDEQRGT